MITTSSYKLTSGGEYLVHQGKIVVDHRCESTVAGSRTPPSGSSSGYTAFGGSIF